MARRLNADERAEAVDRFERATELPLLVLALLMVPLLILPFLVELPAAADATLLAIDWFIWAAFALQFGVRLWLTPDPKFRFVLRAWPDVLIIVVPFLRPLRIVQSARALRILRLARLIGFLGEIGHQSRRLMTRHSLHYVVLATIGVVFASAALTLHAEEGSGGSISSFGNALWWAITTVTTVGYGDTYPVTPAGRGLAAFLMVLGIAFFGVLTANVAAFFVERGQADVEAEVVASDAKLDEILRKLEELEAMLVSR
jgi:voltage-gated potassium channel